MPSPNNSYILYFIVWWWSGAYFLKLVLGVLLGNEMQMLRCFGMRRCACSEHMKHMSNVEQIHETKIRYAHSGLSDIRVLCSQNMWAFICKFDWNCLPTAELERHYTKNGNGNQEHGMQ